MSAIPSYRFSSRSPRLELGATFKSSPMVAPKTPGRQQRAAPSPDHPQAPQFMRAELSNDGQTINLPSGRFMQVDLDISSLSSDKTEDGDPLTSSVAAPRATMATLPSSPPQLRQDPPPPASRMSRREPCFLVARPRTISRDGTSASDAAGYEVELHQYDRLGRGGTSALHSAKFMFLS